MTDEVPSDEDRRHGDGDARPGDGTVEAAYDTVAETYDEDVENNAYNAELEMPGTTSLIPDVAGRRVLDAGCGTGIYSEWLRERGAEVVGVDASREMLARARERLGATDGERDDPPVEFHRADLAEPLDFPDESFDGVVSALVLDYVEDWHATFAEFARVLRPGGFLVFSVGHPVEEYVDNEDVTYFDRERVTKQWDVEIPYYRRPLADVLEPLLAAGLRLDGIVEPEPTDRFRELRPEAYEKESRQPVFLCLRAVHP
jgi:ubiquinone/menaquinone biosynthesis C-methylase UbiE